MYRNAVANLKYNQENKRHKKMLNLLKITKFSLNPVC